MRGLKIGLAAAVAGLLAVVIAVVIALQSLPDYESLKSSPNGQMIRVHAADGTLQMSSPNGGPTTIGAELPRRVDRTRSPRAEEVSDVDH